MKVEDREPIAKAVAQLRGGERPIPPFHWQIEFAKVFTVEATGTMNGAFDAVVGNPPFLGGPQLTHLFGGPSYQGWLKECHDQAFGNADLSAYFFRRAFSLIRGSGTLGMLATKSISEGSTRTTSLQPILAAGGVIYNANRSLNWPGEASVLVAVVHLAASRRELVGPRILGDRAVPFISSRVLPSPELPDPECFSQMTCLPLLGLSSEAAVSFLMPLNTHPWP